jgi:hypothetical protein
MKTKAMISILIISIFFGISTAQADVVWTEGYHELNTGDSHEHVGIYNDVQLNIYGGGTEYLHTYDSTLTNWYNGQISYLLVNDNSIINIYGGKLWTGLGASNNSIINLYAHDVILTHTGGYWDTGQLTGIYNLNNQSFSFDLWGSNTDTHIIIIPEPSTLFLLGIGCLFLRQGKISDGCYNFIFSNSTHYERKKS